MVFAQNIVEGEFLFSQYFALLFSRSEAANSLPK